MNRLVFTGLCAIVVMLSLTACGSGREDDSPDDKTSVYGTWKCVEAEIKSIDLGGISLPPEAEETIKEQIEDDLEGATIVLKEKEIRLDGEYVVFRDSGIKWHVLSLSDNRLKVAYDLDSSYAYSTFKMKVEAIYVRM